MKTKLCLNFFVNNFRRISSGVFYENAFLKKIVKLREEEKNTCNGVPFSIELDALSCSLCKNMTYV